MTFVNLLLPFFKDFSQTWESEGFSTSENPWHCFPLVPLEAFGHEILIARDMPKGIELCGKWVKVRSWKQGKCEMTMKIRQSATFSGVNDEQPLLFESLFPIPFSPPGNDEPMNPGHKPLRILHETEVLCELVIFGC